jgi:Tfp pilus assembly protein PilV
MSPTDSKTHSPRRTWSKQRGASLMETMVALGLFALTAATMSRFLTENIRRGSSNNLYTVAYSLAAQALEDARALNYADMAACTTSHAEGGVTFNVATTVEDDTPQTSLKTITATVDWTEPGGARIISVPVVYTEVRPF